MTERTMSGYTLSYFAFAFWVLFRHVAGEWASAARHAKQGPRLPQTSAFMAETLEFESRPVSACSQLGREAIIGSFCSSDSCPVVDPSGRLCDERVSR